MNKKEVKNLILAALENSEFKWRTARGISKEIGLPVQKVQDFLENSPAILRSKKPNKSGKPLYTTRERYKKSTPLTKRLLAALRNEAT